MNDRKLRGTQKFQFKTIACHHCSNSYLLKIFALGLTITNQVYNHLQWEKNVKQYCKGFLGHHVLDYTYSRTCALRAQSSRHPSGRFTDPSSKFQLREGMGSSINHVSKFWAFLIPSPLCGHFY